MHVILIVMQMKHFLPILLLAVAGIALPARAQQSESHAAYAPEAVQAYSKDAVTGLYFESVNGNAVIVINQDKKKNGQPKPYATSPMVIPATFTIAITGMGDQGESSGSETLPVTELGAYALMDATFTSLSFAEPSNLRVFRTGALMNVNKISGTLALPSSLEEIETQGIIGASMQITKLVIPAGLQNLAISSILLPNLQEIEFLGSVPPSCAVDVSDPSACNPWVSASLSTPASVSVVVPDGAYNTYKDAAGIGDYFTCFASSGPTDLSENGQTPVAADKFFRNGRLYILRNGRIYNAVGEEQ